MNAILDAASLRRELAEREPAARDVADAVRIVRAPGRVNLIGEHTDYNQGFVLPAAISLETWICFLPTDNRDVELTRLDTRERLGFDLDSIGSQRGEWIDYLAGTARALADDGVALRGLRGVIASTVPISSGLSSSAALELAAAWALSAEMPPPRTPMELAQLAQRAENEYVGVRSGIMDQFASAHGRPDAALLLDCRSLEYRPVPLPLDRATLVVCDSNAPRDLATSAYNARREQCERAVSALAELGRPVTSLRDVDMAMLEKLRGVVDNETIRRCEHVIRENERVLAAERALLAGDLRSVGRLFAESHASLRDLYEVSSPELDALVEIAAGTDGVFGARMTGAGFGGCTVNLVAHEAVETLREAVAREYAPRTGREANVHVVRPAAGAGRVHGA